ncbi:hypothetical protein [Rahnella aquatilis]|uniref:Uncharacterized protein n=1 Tax=Rahnella aquatilis (strain ATCC 33071 / DSM 4594 / JCM 1683 / NBRC 105701 / NCIMB 13365 / CIP 78.65) TaxID=745277 RepID=H2J1V7_RAHAC|nr:hypothetical protein [Rahnella aquatilis]AEX54554.1 hypothetical protein Rahaq2_4835 [Rahnella aquatilis CIP 78.65 = ATCC 33071]KFD00035.1 hypothetical protein GRAQ_04619 [Rahnella aquatilis CIP 78.65 = ATCC 33071]
MSGSLSRWARITCTSALLLSFTAIADQQGRQQLQEHFADQNRQQEEQMRQIERQQSQYAADYARESQERVDRQIKEQEETTTRIQNEAIATHEKRDAEAREAARQKREQAGDPERN